MIHRFVTLAIMGVAMAAPVVLAEPFVDDFSGGAGKWDFAHPGMWSVKDGALQAKVSEGLDTRALAKAEPAADLLLETELRFAAGSPRQNFGFVFRAADDEHRLVLRYYDQPKALELLSFHGTTWNQIGERSAPLKVTAGEWYALRLVAVGPNVLSKLWPSGQAEPDWQFHARVEALHSGRAGLVVHDAGDFEFRNFTLSTESPTLRKLQEQAEAERQARLKQVRASLRLAVAPREFPEGKGTTRVVEVAPYSDADRYPVSGRLIWKMNGETTQRPVTTADYHGQALLIELPEPAKTERVEVTLFADDLELKGAATLEPAVLKPWRHYVKESIETLIKHGRDDYGPQKTPLIMAVLDTTTLRSPREPERLDAIVRLEGRLHRRAERGSNLWYDQGLINAMRRLSDLTGNAKYAGAADAYLTHFLPHCNKPKDNQPYHTGLPAWGSHIYWDCYQERSAGDQNGSGPHEILVFRANWPDMYRLAPKEVRRIAEAVWEHHIVDKKTGRHNRHDDGKAGCDFAFSGGSFLQLFAAMSKLTGEAHYLDKARTVADWHWKNRNKETNLPADCPGLTQRYDGQHTFTTVSGPHAMTLLAASQVSGDDYFRQIATTYIKAYDKFAWDEKAQSYYAMLKLDGTPVPDRAKGAGYDAYAPYGHVNVWRTTFYSYEFTLSAAQAAIQAYEMSGPSKAERDPELLAIATRWATVIEGAMPAHTGRRWKTELEQSMPLAAKTGGAYAEDYGRAISFFVHLHRATGEKHHLDLANQLAEDAVRKLYHHGLFKGHPAKPYYETTNGVGLLLYALLELDAPGQALNGAL